MNSFPKVAFCSHHKCATKWFLDFFQYGCVRMAWNLGNVDNHANFKGDVSDFCNRRKVDMLFYSNACYQDIEGLPIPKVHVVRDPRDILVSGYFSHKNSHETGTLLELVEHRNKLNTVSLEEGLMLELDFSAQFLEPMREWPIDGDGLLTLKFEEFSSWPLDFVVNVIEHLGIGEEKLQISDAWIEPVGLITRALRKAGIGAPGLIARSKLPVNIWLAEAHRRRFSKLARREKGCEDSHSHYRKGVAGDWKNYLRGDLLCAFNNRYGDIVDLYGYSEKFE